jgi:hypothetical protein
MKRAAISCGFLLAITCAIGADTVISPSLATVADREKAGRELAARLRSTPPEEDSEFSGTLKVIPRGEDARNVRITCSVKRIAGTNTTPAWETIYQTQAAGTNPAERLRVCFRAGVTNEYYYVRGESPEKPAAEMSRIGNSQTEFPLAGSDFWLADLGLEFLHWPTQQVVKAEMRRGQPCRVLESINPHPSASGYARVLSWVDNESGGILQAEAYDTQYKLFKEFAVGSFKKIEGRYQLQDMKIRNAKTGSRTWLEFDLR